MNATTLRNDGIYFDLPEDDYLAEERLSKSGIKRLRISPADYWAESHLNPNPPALTPEQERQRHMARLIGRAYHCARLEPRRFAEVYVREVTQADFAKVDGFIATAREIEEALAERGLPKKFKDDKGVADQARRLKDAGYLGPIWHLEEIAWRESVKPGQVVIPAKAYDEIIIDMRRLAKVPSVNALLTGGEPEVSVFWHCAATGIPMKARFDYLKAAGWVEFKTFANAMRKNLNQALVDAVQYERYHIDAAAYLEAAEAIRSGTLQIIGEATTEQRALIAAIQARADELECHFVFQQKGGVPNILDRKWTFWEGVADQAIEELERTGATEERIAAARKFQKDAPRHRSVIHERARLEISAAKRAFLAYSEIYDRGEEWLPFNPSGSFSDADFSLYFLDRPIDA